VHTSIPNYILSLTKRRDLVIRVTSSTTPEPARFLTDLRGLPTKNPFSLELPPLGDSGSSDGGVETAPERQAIRLKEHDTRSSCQRKSPQAYRTKGIAKPPGEVGFHPSPTEDVAESRLTSSA
jgi:hypothetical protein